MADYKELLRRAIEALPENNGAARRAVYEKARSALVTQLRSIDPPLPAREITQHRLQLEDCIRQVEQEASEANLSGLRRSVEEPVRSAPAVQSAPVPPKPEPQPEPVPEPEPVFVAAEPEPEPQPEPEAVFEDPVSESIEDIIAAADQPEPEPEDFVEPVAEDEAGYAEMPPIEPVRDFSESVRPFPTIVPRGDIPPLPANEAGPVPVVPFEPPRRGPAYDVRFEGNAAAQQADAPSFSSPTPRVEPSIIGQTAALQKVAEPLAVLDQPVGQTATTPAMSSVREVDVEEDDAQEAQVAIDRAIATLDREARGDLVAGDAGQAAPAPSVAPTAAPFTSFAPPPPLDGLKSNSRGTDAGSSAEAELGFARTGSEEERGGFNAITVFLIVFIVLLLGAGGAGFWAWREGYVDIDSMFGRTTQSADAGSAQTTAPEGAGPAEGADDNATAPGNTATPEATQPTAELQPDARLSGSPDGQAVPGEPSANEPAGTEDKSEERLPSAEDAAPGTQIAPSQAPILDSTATAGSQSLLLEAADNGSTGAVPFSGTIDWSQGTDETGAPTIVGKASIPARNLSVDLLIRRNVDPSLPASHLMEINFSVTDSFIGGSIAGLPGVLLKNEELVQGTPLVGASARVVGNSFLFALSGSDTDAQTNVNLLTTRRWLDLAVVYATGKRAIITLEKDDAAEALFKQVFDNWAQNPVSQTP